MSEHVSECNIDFKENVLRKVQTIKLKDTSELNKKVEELKKQEASELNELNKHYTEIDVECKKLERKVSIFIFEFITLYLYIERWLHQCH